MFTTSKVICACLLFWSAVANATLIELNVSGNVGPFSNGPFSDGDALSLSLEWDSDTPRDSGLSFFSQWDTAAKNITLTIGSYVATGTDAEIVQRDNTTNDIVEISLGIVSFQNHGTVTSGPPIGDFNFEGLFLRFFSSNLLFPAGDTSTLISSPDGMSVNALRVYFDDNDAGTGSDDLLTVHNTVFTITAESVPASSGLVLMPLVLLLAWCRRLARNQGSTSPQGG